MIISNSNKEYLFLGLLILIFAFLLPDIAILVVYGLSIFFIVYFLFIFISSIQGVRN